MKVLPFQGIIKNIIEFLQREHIERTVFKLLLVVWFFVIIAVIVLWVTHSTRSDIEKIGLETTTDATYPFLNASEIQQYESSLTLAKYPEEIEKYTSKMKRDPFSDHAEELLARPLGGAKYDFVLKSVEKVQLPLVYKGYIELPDKIIGQINWRDATRFVKTGSTLDNYRICSISKEKIEAIDEKGKKIEFERNKPVFSEELRAVLYDSVSDRTFDVQIASEIENYKVIDIAPEYVILLADGKEIRLEKRAEYQ